MFCVLTSLLPSSLPTTSTPAACLRATDFPTVWIFREPFIPARPWPPQQDLEHLTTPHDCHHLRVAFTAGDCPINGLADAPQENGGLGESIFIFFFLDTVGMCRMNPVNFLLFFPPPVLFFSFVTLVFLSFSKELRDGPNQNQSYLTIFFCCISIYWSLILNVRRYSEEKCLMNKNDWRSGWPFSFICLLLIVIEISYGRITDVVPQWKKRHFNIWLLYRLSHPFFGRERIVKFWRSCRGPGSFNSSFNFTSSAHLLTLLKQSHLLLRQVTVWSGSFFFWILDIVNILNI